MIKFIKNIKRNIERKNRLDAIRIVSGKSSMSNGLSVIKSFERQNNVKFNHKDLLHYSILARAGEYREELLHMIRYVKKIKAS